MTKLICCGAAALWMTGAAVAEEEETDLVAAEVTAETPHAGMSGSSTMTGNSTQLSQPASGRSSTAAAGGNAAGAVPVVAAAEAAPPQDSVVPTPPAPRIAVQPYHDKVDRAKVEKRIEDKATRTRKRTADAEKDAAARAANQGQAAGTNR